MTFIGNNLDIVIAVSLVLIVIIMFMIAQTGILPKRSLPFIAAALVGAFGIVIFRGWRKSVLRAELEKREKELEVQEKRLTEIKAKTDVSVQELNKVKAEVNKQQAAYKKEILIIDAKKKEEINRIDEMSEEEVFEEFANAFGTKENT